MKKNEKVSLLPSRLATMVRQYSTVALLVGQWHVGQAHLLRERGEIIPAGVTRRYGVYTIIMRINWEIELSRS
jgi:hypothetical protein